MKILIWHGYLLRGTGSNIYVNNIGRALVKLGHDIVILCQDPQAFSIDFVTRYVGVRNGIEVSKETHFEGSCTVIQPDIGDLLPVYVLDDYEGFQRVKTMLALTDREREHYIDSNVEALKEAAAGQRPDFVMTNHAVCSPVIAGRADLDAPFFSYVHGSAIEYVIKKDRLYYDLAVEGLEAAKGVMAGSSYQQEEVLRLFGRDIPGLKDKMNRMPCGVDAELFKLDLDYENACSDLESSFAELDKTKCLGVDALNALESEVAESEEGAIIETIKEFQQRYDYTLPELPFVESNLDFNPGLKDPDSVNIYFLGKLIPQKGLQVLLLAFSELLAQGEKATLTITAFGKYREHFELMLRALSSGNRELLSSVLSLDKHFREIKKAFESRDDAYFEAVKLADPHSHVFFTGRLGHAEIKNVLPFMDLLVFPSLIPEAFGMVAIEGMACGVLSAMTYFSGMTDIVDTAQNYLDGKIMNLIRIDRGNMLEDLRGKLALLVEEAGKRTPETRATLRKIVVENFTWERIAGNFLDWSSSF